MNDTRTRLLDLIAPPSRPVSSKADGEWEALQSRINFPFPEDFLWLGSTYGTGEIDSSGYGLMVASPVDPNYASWATDQSEMMGARDDESSQFYPCDGGILPFAEDWSGDLLFFNPHGLIVSCPGGDPRDLVHYEHELLDFLLHLFMGKLRPEYFPNNELAGATPTFRAKRWM